MHPAENCGSMPICDFCPISRGIDEVIVIAGSYALPELRTWSINQEEAIKKLKRESEDHLAILGAEAALEEQLGDVFGDEADTTAREKLEEKNKAHEEAIVFNKAFDATQDAYLTYETARVRAAQGRLRRTKAIQALATEECRGNPYRIGPLSICATKAALFGKGRVPLWARVRWMGF